jgi:hypothetical protein
MLRAQVGTNGRLQVALAQGALELLVSRLKCAKQGLAKQRLLRFKVRVECADGQVGLGHDLRESYRGDALLPKAARRRRQDALARRFVVSRGVSHGFLPYRTEMGLHPCSFLISV